MADFALLETPKLISRKIWVIEKAWNFHTVPYLLSWWNFENCFWPAISCPTQFTFIVKKAKSTFLLERTLDSIFYGEKSFFLGNWTPCWCLVSKTQSFRSCSLLHLLQKQSCSYFPLLLIVFCIKSRPWI